MGQLHEAYNLCVTGVPEKMERTEEIFETIMSKNLPQFQEAQRMPVKINAKKPHNQLLRPLGHDI